MLAVSMLVLFGVSLGYALYRLVRKLIGILIKFNSRVEDIRSRADIAAQAWRYGNDDPDMKKD
jgi:hypothetical protein